MRSGRLCHVAQFISATRSQGGGGVYGPLALTSLRLPSSGRGVQRRVAGAEDPYPGGGPQHRR